MAESKAAMDTTVVSGQSRWIVSRISCLYCHWICKWKPEWKGVLCLAGEKALAETMIRGRKIDLHLWKDEVFGLD